MQSDLLPGKRIKVIFADNNPSGTNSGWKKYENRQTLWVVISGSDAILLEAATRIVVPGERYVRSAAPPVKGQRAVCTVRCREERGKGGIGEQIA